jgi:hypothetical protein
MLARIMMIAICVIVVPARGTQVSRTGVWLFPRTSVIGKYAKAVNRP